MEYLLAGVKSISMSTSNIESSKTLPRQTSSSDSHHHFNHLINSNEELYTANEEKEILEQVSKTLIDKWWGRLLTKFGSQFPDYSNQIEKWFSFNDNDLWRCLNQDAVRISGVEKCPHVIVNISDIQLFKISKKTHTYYFELFLSSDPDYKYRIEAIEGSSHTFKFHLDDPEDIDSTFLEILLEKDGTFDKGLKGRAQINLSFVHGEVPILWSDRETSRVHIEIKTKNLNVTPAHEVVPRILTNHFKEVLIDDAVFDTLRGYVDLPKYFIEFSEVRVGDILSGLETRVYLNNVIIQDEVDGKPSPSNFKFKFPFLNLMKDTLKICLFSKNKKSEVYSKEMKIIEWVSPIGKCSELYIEHIARTTYQWTLTLMEESVKKNDSICSMGESLFLILYYNRLDTLLNEREYTEDNSVLLKWQGSFDDKHENLLKVLNVFDPKKRSWATEKSRALLKLHSKYRFNNLVLSSLFSGIDTNELDNYEYLKNYIDYALYHLSYYVTVGNYSRLPLPQLKSLLANVLIFNNEDESHVLELLKPYMIDSIITRHDLNNLNNHKIILEQSIMPSIRGTPRLFDSFGTKLIVKLTVIYLDLSLPILRTVITHSTCDCTNGLLTFNIFVKSRSLASVIGGKEEKEYMKRIYNIFTVCLDSWVECSLSEANKQVTRVLQLERNRHKKSISSQNNNYKHQDSLSSEDDEYEGVLDGAFDIEGIFDTCRYVWNEIQWPFPSGNIRFGAKLLQGLHSTYTRYITEFDDILMNSDNDPTLNTDELITILNSSHRSVSYLNKFHSAINSLIDKHTGESESLDPEVCSQISDYLEILTEASREIDSRNDDLVEYFCLSQKPIISEYIRKRGIVGDGSEEDKSSLYYINLTLETLYANIDTGNPKQDEMIHNKIKSSLTELHETLVCEYYKSLKSEYDRKGRNPEVFQNISDGIQHMIGFRRTLSMEDNPDILSLNNELYPRSYSSDVLIYQHLKHIHENDDLLSSNVVGIVKLEITSERINQPSILNVHLKNIRDVIPPEGKKSSNFSISLALLPSSSLQRVRTGIYADSENVLFDLVGEEQHESSKHIFPMELTTTDKSELFLSLELFEHSRTLQKKTFRGFGLVALSCEEKTQVCQELQLRSMEASVLDAVEFQELIKRKDKIAKDYVYRMRKYVHKKSILLNVFGNKQEWIRV